MAHPRLNFFLQQGIALLNFLNQGGKMAIRGGERCRDKKSVSLGFKRSESVPFLSHSGLKHLLAKLENALKLLFRTHLDASWILAGGNFRPG